MKPGDIFWIKNDERVSHPRVIIEIGIKSVHVVSLTTNTKKIAYPGNVIIEKGEGNLEKRSLAEVAKNEWISKEALLTYVGSLDKIRVKEIINGIGFLERTYSLFYN
jgi:mRNA interferase MazF